VSSDAEATMSGLSGEVARSLMPLFDKLLSTEVHCPSTYASMANEGLPSVSRYCFKMACCIHEPTLTNLPCFTLYTLTLASVPATQSQGSWVTGSRDQQLAQFSFSCHLVRRELSQVMGRASTYTIIPDELNDFAWVGLLVRGLCQPAHNRLRVGSHVSSSQDAVRWGCRAYMLLTSSSKDRRCAWRVVWVELNIKELGQVWGIESATWSLREERPRSTLTSLLII
jgi:hypothetical protein